MSGNGRYFSARLLPTCRFCDGAGGGEEAFSVGLPAAAALEAPPNGLLTAADNASCSRLLSSASSLPPKLEVSVADSASSFADSASSGPSSAGVEGQVRRPWRVLPLEQKLQGVVLAGVARPGHHTGPNKASSSSSSGTGRQPGVSHGF